MADSSEELIPTQVALQYLRENAESYGVDPDTAVRMFYAENVGKGNKLPTSVSTKTTSPAGAVGLMQVLPKTLQNIIKQGYISQERANDGWRGQLNQGLASIAAMQKEQGTKDPDVLAVAYNAGFNPAKAFNKSGEVNGLPAETKEYLKKVGAADIFFETGASQRDVRAVENQIAAGAPAPVTPEGTIQKLSSSIQQFLTNGKQVMEGLIEQTTGSAASAEKAKGDAAAAALRSGTAAANAAALEGTIGGLRESMKERVATVLNLDTRTAENLVSTELGKQAELDQQMAPLKAEIDARMSVGFFDNPLEWLVNQTVLPGQVATYNAMTQGYNTSVSNVRAAQKTAKDQLQVDVAGVAEMLTKQGIAIADAKVAESQAKAAELRAEGSSIAATRALQVANLRRNMMEDDIRVAEFGIREAERAIERGEKDKKRKEIDEVGAKMKIIGTSIGAPNMSLEVLKGKDKDSKEMWETAVATNSWGGSKFPEITYFIQTEGNWRKMAPEVGQYQQAFQKKVEEQMRVERQKWATEFQGAKKPTEKELYLHSATIVYNKMKDAYDADLSRADAWNPYKAEHKLTVMDWKGNPDNPVFKRIQQAVQNKEEFNDQILFQVLTKQVAAGQVQPKMAAAAMAEYYSQVVARNNVNRSLSMMGFAKQESYNIGVTGEKKPLDLTNVTKLDNYFTGQAAKAIAARSGFVINPETQELQQYPSGGGFMVVPKSPKQAAIQNVFEVPAPQQ